MEFEMVRKGYDPDSQPTIERRLRLIASRLGGFDINQVIGIGGDAHGSGHGGLRFFISIEKQRHIDPLPISGQSSFCYVYIADTFSWIFFGPSAFNRRL